MVKENAPELLRRELSSAKWKPQLLALSGVSDCYRPVERRVQLTRKCLAVLAAVKAAGAGWAYTEVLRRPLKVAPIFQEWLERNVPGKKDKVLNRMRGRCISIVCGRLD